MHFYVLVVSMFYLQLSRPSTNFKSASGYVGCISDAVKIYGGSNYGQVGSCCTPASPACITQYTVDRSILFSLFCFFLLQLGEIELIDDAF